MPPISGESSMDKAERLRKAANALREKARYARVTAILKFKPSVCAKVEELLIQEGELEMELATSPRQDIAKPDPEKPILMLEDSNKAASDDTEFAQFKLEVDSLATWLFNGIIMAPWLFHGFIGYMAITPHTLLAFHSPSPTKPLPNPHPLGLVLTPTHPYLQWRFIVFTTLQIV